MTPTQPCWLSCQSGSSIGRRPSCAITSFSLFRSLGSNRDEERPDSLARRADCVGSVEDRGSCAEGNGQFCPMIWRTCRQTGSYRSPIAFSTASAAESLRSLCGSLRGAPVCNSQASPMAAPQVLQGTDNICFGVSSLVFTRTECNAYVRERCSILHIVKDIMKRRFHSWPTTALSQL